MTHVNALLGIQKINKLQRDLKKVGRNSYVFFLRFVGWSYKTDGSSTPTDDI